MKKKLLRVLPCVALLTLFSIVSYSNTKNYYDELLSTSGLISKNSGKELKKEDNQVKKIRENNQNYITKQDYSGDTSQEGDKSSASIEKIKLHSRAALLLDASNNRVLYEENGYKEMPMASTTKIMTCIVALENSKPDEVVTASSNAARMPDVQLNMKTGEQFYLKDLLYSLMLESHNDTAVAIAEHVGGSVEGFATMMNAKAKELGCEHTNFVTPNGLDADGHHTTAQDLAIIASYAIKNKDFIEVTNTSSHEFKEIKSKKSFHVSNKNRFLYMMDGAIGVKTGFTNDAGYCFVGAIKKTDRTLISVVLGCGWPPRKMLKWSDTKELMDYGIDNFDERQIFENADLAPIFVNKGQQKYENLAMEGDLKLLMRKDEKVNVIYDIPNALQAPVKANSVIGYAKYYINDNYYTQVPIHATQNIAKIDMKYCFDKIARFWCGQY